MHILIGVHVLAAMARSFPVIVLLVRWYLYRTMSMHLPLSSSSRLLSSSKFLDCFLVESHLPVAVLHEGDMFG